MHAKNSRRLSLNLSLNGVWRMESGAWSGCAGAGNVLRTGGQDDEMIVVVQWRVTC